MLLINKSCNVQGTKIEIMIDTNVLSLDVLTSKVQQLKEAKKIVSELAKELPKTESPLYIQNRRIAAKDILSEVLGFNAAFNAALKLGYSIEDLTLFQKPDANGQIIVLNEAQINATFAKGKISTFLKFATPSQISKGYITPSEVVKIAVKIGEMSPSTFDKVRLAKK